MTKNAAQAPSTVGMKMSPERAAAEQRDRDERQARIIASFAK